MKKLAIEGWQRGRRNRLLKVVSVERGAGSEVGGYVTNEKSILGLTPAQMELALGLPRDALASGAIILSLERNPTAAEFELRGYTQLPDGKTWVEGDEYRKGHGVPQWELTKRVPAKVVKAIEPGETYRRPAKG